MTKRRGQEHTT